jgi:two-component system, LytTR family, sensor kinase
LALEMKTQCEGCGKLLGADAEAHICSYECTYCAECATDASKICPHCGGELNPRPRRNAEMNEAPPRTEAFQVKRPGLIWTMSFAVWSLFGLIATLSVIQLLRTQGNAITFREASRMEFSQMMAFAPLTPFVFMLVARFPIRRKNWVRRSMLYLLGGLVFTAGHVGIRGMTPYGIWDSSTHAWHSAVWDDQAHKVKVQWSSLGDMFLSSAFDDITSTYLPIVFIAYVMFYYSTLKDRERRSAQLEAQLTKANLQALKSQLQPHFLFNTMHSISALMLTDVSAADKMMTRLSELLRMSLEDGMQQMTTLSRELEFVNGYLEIEKMRLGERLSVFLDISPDTLDAQVPHLLLQPLVENAVKHGIASLSSKGQLSISGRHEADTLHIIIRDNGPGFAGSNGSSQKRGLGIRTSQERLRNLYGGNQSLQFARPSDGGTELTIRIPFRQTIQKE